MNELLNRRVAVLTQEATEDSFIIFDRKTWGCDRYMIGTPISIDYLPAQTLSYSPMLTQRSVTKFEPRLLQITTVFDNSNLLDQEDLIRIRFNSGRTFISEETGLSIDPGTELFVHMDLQIDSETRSSLEGGFICIITFIVILVIGTTGLNFSIGTGQMLPIWMLISSTQLIAYTVLLDLPASSNAVYFLRRFLDALRFNGKDDLFQIESNESESYFKMLKNESQDYSMLHMQMLGYRPWLIDNLAPLLYILVVFTGI